MTNQPRARAEQITELIERAITAVRCDSSEPVGSFLTVILQFGAEIEEQTRNEMQAERERLHRLLQGADALIDPEEYPELSAGINAVLSPCDEAGRCVAPLSEKPK